MRGGFAVVVLACLAAAGGCAALSDRDRGRAAGMKAVRNARDMNGPMGEAFMRMAEVGPWPADKDKSPEWNGGFREGVKEELDHPTPRE